MASATAATLIVTVAAWSLLQQPAFDNKSLHTFNYRRTLFLSPFCLETNTSGLYESITIIFPNSLTTIYRMFQSLFNFSLHASRTLPTCQRKTQDSRNCLFDVHVFQIVSYSCPNRLRRLESPTEALSQCSNSIIQSRNAALWTKLQPQGGVFFY